MKLVVNEELITIVPEMVYVTNGRRAGEASIKICISHGKKSLSDYQKECIERCIKELLKEAPPKAPIELTGLMRAVWK
jgi:hypothetical protein